MIENRICRIHGELSADQVEKQKDKTSYYFRCKLCHDDSRVRTLTQKNFKCSIHGVLTLDLIKSNGRCKLCHRVSASSKRNANRPEFNEKQKTDRLINPEKWDEIYKKDYERQKLKYGQLLSLVKCCAARGISVDDYQSMEEKQNNLCAICYNPETRINGTTKIAGRLVIDHCHKTNKVRGLLCHGCNAAIGLLKDDSLIITRAARYVKQKGWS